MLFQGLIFKHTQKTVKMFWGLWPSAPSNLNYLQKTIPHPYPQGHPAVINVSILGVRFAPVPHITAPCLQTVNNREVCCLSLCLQWCIEQCGEPVVPVLCKKPVFSKGTFTSNVMMTDHSIKKYPKSDIFIGKFCWWISLSTLPSPNRFVFKQTNKPTNISGNIPFANNKIIEHLKTKTKG